MRSCWTGTSCWRPIRQSRCRSISCRAAGSTGASIRWRPCTARCSKRRGGGSRCSGGWGRSGGSPICRSTICGPRRSARSIWHGPCGGWVRRRRRGIRQCGCRWRRGWICWGMPGIGRCWRRRWASGVPVEDDGRHVVGEVAGSGVVGQRVKQRVVQGTALCVGQARQKADKAILPKIA